MVFSFVLGVAIFAKSFVPMVTALAVDSFFDLGMTGKALFVGDFATESIVVTLDTTGNGIIGFVRFCKWARGFGNEIFKKALRPKCFSSVTRDEAKTEKTDDYD